MKTRGNASAESSSFTEHIDVARRGGNVAKEARLKLEAETGKPVVTPLNAKDILELGSRDEESSNNWHLIRHGV